MRCRIGDLAVITHSVQPLNVGRFVTVVSRSTYPTCDWECESAGSLLAGVTRVTKQLRLGYLVNFRDNQLRPIRDEEDPQETVRDVLASIKDAA